MNESRVLSVVFFKGILFNSSFLACFVLKASCFISSAFFSSKIFKGIPSGDV